MIGNQNTWIEEYKKRDALWIHDRNPKRPHALLTSGKHSSGFFNSELVMEDPTLLDEACRDLAEILFEEGINLDGIDRVVGPAMGAITLAHDLARRINHKRSGGIHPKPCLSGYAEKSEDGKSMVFKRTKIRLRERILMAEDVLTTGGSVNRTATAIVEAGGNIAPYFVVLVNRSGLKDIEGKKIIALIDCPMPIWEPDACPLCKQGSAVIRPKSKEQWALLNAEY